MLFRSALPEAFRVLLDGPEDRRIVEARELEGVDESTARERLERSNAIRQTYWKRLYNRDWKDQAMFDMYLDTTVIPAEAAADVIAAAATAFWDAKG